MCARGRPAVQRSRARALAAILLALAASGAIPGAAAALPDGFQPGAPVVDTVASAALRTLVGSGRHPALRRSGLADQLPALQRLYAAREWRPLWFSGGRPLPAIGVLAALVARAAEDGLRPEDYESPWLEATRAALATRPPGRGADLAPIDVGLSVAALRFLHERAHGRVDPRTLGVRLDGPAPRDLAAELAVAVPGGRLQVLADSAIPPTWQYLKVREALARYRTLAVTAPPPPGFDSTALRPGDAWQGGPALRRFLEAMGDLDPATREAAEDSAYAAALVTGVQRFQGRHGLEPDGIVGRRTRAAFREPLSTRIRQLELSMERLRWLPDLRGESFLLVNIADFTLYAFDAARGSSSLPSRWMRVIVGQAARTETPVFQDWMQYVVFRPYWNVPRSITLGEVVPKALRDSTWLGRNGYDLVRAGGPEDGPAVAGGGDALDLAAAGVLRIRQRPGPGNALGRVKFIFPNDENIYLHDTPEQALFSRERRDFSHGCIRVEDPAWLAGWVLRDQPEWNAEAVAEAMAGPPVPRTVHLTVPLRVIIFYATAAVRPDAKVAFHDDVYGYDRVLERALGR